MILETCGTEVNFLAGMWLCGLVSCRSITVLLFAQHNLAFSSFAWALWPEPYLLLATRLVGCTSSHSIDLERLSIN